MVPQPNWSKQGFCFQRLASPDRPKESVDQDLRSLLANAVPDIDRKDLNTIFVWRGDDYPKVDFSSLLNSVNNAGKANGMFTCRFTIIWLVSEQHAADYQQIFQQMDQAHDPRLGNVRTRAATVIVGDRCHDGSILQTAATDGVAAMLYYQGHCDTPNLLSTGTFYTLGSAHLAQTEHDFSLYARHQLALKLEKMQGQPTADALIGITLLRENLIPKLNKYAPAHFCYAEGEAAEQLDANMSEDSLRKALMADVVDPWSQDLMERIDNTPFLDTAERLFGDEGQISEFASRIFVRPRLENTLRKRFLMGGKKKQLVEAWNEWMEQAGSKQSKVYNLCRDLWKEKRAAVVSEVQKRRTQQQQKFSEYSTASATVNMLETQFSEMTRLVQSGVENYRFSDRDKGRYYAPIIGNNKKEIDQCWIDFYHRVTRDLAFQPEKLIDQELKGHSTTEVERILTTTLDKRSNLIRIGLAVNTLDHLKASKRTVWFVRQDISIPTQNIDADTEWISVNDMQNAIALQIVKLRDSFKPADELTCFKSAPTLQTQADDLQSSRDDRHPEDITHAIENPDNQPEEDAYNFRIEQTENSEECIALFNWPANCDVVSIWRNGDHLFSFSRSNGESQRKVVTDEMRYEDDVFDLRISTASGRMETIAHTSFRRRPEVVFMQDEAKSYHLENMEFEDHCVTFSDDLGSIGELNLALSFKDGSRYRLLQSTDRSGNPQWLFTITTTQGGDVPEIVAENEKRYQVVIV